MLSFMMEPPMSLHPTRRSSPAQCGPILTQDAWMLSTQGNRTRRDTACISSASRSVGPARARPLRNIGASMCTNGSGTNSVKPLVSRCSALHANTCHAHTGA